MPGHTPRSALLFALAGFATLSIGDALVKSMAGAWPGSAVSALRYASALVWLTVAVAAKHGRAGFAVPRPALQLGRGIGVSISTVCLFAAVMAMPLADATAIQFTSPMLTGLLSAMFLGERAPRAVWTATALAFAGVLIVLRPNLMAIGPAAFWPLGGACGMALLIIFNRKAAGLAPVLVMQFILAVFATPLLIVTALLLHWSGLPGFHIGVPPAQVVVKALIISVSATVAHLLIYMGTIRASAAVIAPMSYVQLLVAVAFGWIFFGEPPDAPTLIGAALIVGGGLWLWRSQKEPVVPETAD